MLRRSPKSRQIQCRLGHRPSAHATGTSFASVCLRWVNDETISASSKKTPDARLGAFPHGAMEDFTMSVQMQKKDRPATQSQTASRDEDRNGANGDRETLIAGLNGDLAGEYQAIVMYTHYAARLTGPYRKELRALFQG